MSCRRVVLGRAGVTKRGKSWVILHGRTGQVLRRFRGRGAEGRAGREARAMCRLAWYQNLFYIRSLLTAAQDEAAETLEL